MYAHFTYTYSHLPLTFRLFFFCCLWDSVWIQSCCRRRCRCFCCYPCCWQLQWQFAEELDSAPLVEGATFAFWVILFLPLECPRGIAHISILSIFIANGPFSLISTHKWRRPEHIRTRARVRADCRPGRLAADMAHESRAWRIFKFLCVFITIFMPCSGWARPGSLTVKKLERILAAGCRLLPRSFPVPTPPVINWFLCACQLPEMRDTQQEKWNSKIIQRQTEWGGGIAAVAGVTALRTPQIPLALVLFGFPSIFLLFGCKQNFPFPFNRPTSKSRQCKNNIPTKLHTVVDWHASGAEWRSAIPLRTTLRIHYLCAGMQHKHTKPFPFSSRPWVSVCVFRKWLLLCRVPNAQTHFHSHRMFQQLSVGWPKGQRKRIRLHVAMSFDIVQRREGGFDVPLQLDP